MNCTKSTYDETSQDITATYDKNIVYLRIWDSNPELQNLDLAIDEIFLQNNSTFKIERFVML